MVDDLYDENLMSEDTEQQEIRDFTIEEQPVKKYKEFTAEEKKTIRNN